MTALNEKATLIWIEGSVWRAVTQDRTATDGAADLFDTTGKWVMASTRLVDPEVLKRSRRILSQARNYLAGKSPGMNDGKTIPGGLPAWDGKGQYILPNILNEQVTRNLGAFQSAFSDAVEELRAVLPTAIETARSENPKLFDENNYGSIDELIGRFTFKIDRSIIPDSGDIRIEASREFVDAMKATIESRSTKKLKEVADHTVKTVIDVATHLAESLENYDPDKKGNSPFRDSTVDKVRDLISVIPALNINNDPHLDKVRTDLVDAVGNKSAKELREDDEDRKEVAAKARAVADNISNLFD